MEKTLRAVQKVAPAQSSELNFALRSYFPPRSKKCQFDSLEVLHPSVLQHVAPQMRDTRETTTAAGNGAETRALWASGHGYPSTCSNNKHNGSFPWDIKAEAYLPSVHRLVLFQPPVSGERRAAARVGAVAQLQRRTAVRFPAVNTIHFL